MSPEGAGLDAQTANATKAGAEADVLLYCGPIDWAGFEAVVRQCPPSPAEEVLVALATMGGDIDPAYRIARFLREAYTSVTAFVPGMCKSAGTLICIGANEVVIGDAGELGPLDVQVKERDELFSYTSGLAIPQALAFLEGSLLNAVRAVLVDMSGGGGLSVERAAEIAVKTASGAFAPIYSQINPVRLGEVTRSQNIALEYAERLRGDMKSASVARLVYGYPSHAFVIDRKEAADLFPSVRKPNEGEVKLAQELQLDSALSAESKPRAIVYLRNGDTLDGSGVEAQGSDRSG